MAGFIGGFALVSAGLIETSGYLSIAAFSLSIYAASLGVAYLGDPFEFRRRYADDDWEPYAKEQARSIPLPTAPAPGRGGTA